MGKKVFCTLLIVISTTAVFGQKAQQWVDSVFQTLNLDQKVTQLFLQEVNLRKDDEARKALHETTSHGLGGVVFTGGSARQVKELANELQKSSKVPLLIGLDAEWGAGKTLDSTYSFPLPFFLSASTDSLLIATSRLIGLQLKSIGVNFNFSPLLHTSVNLVGDTLYYFWGNQANHVETRALLFSTELKRNGILPFVKDFHLPSAQANGEIPSSKNFQTLMRLGIDGIMPSMLSIPRSLQTKAAIKKIKFIPTSVTNVLTNSQFQKKLNYHGLLIGDVSAVKLNSGKKRLGEPELFAFQSGNDVLFNSTHKSIAVRKIKKLVKREKIYAEQLDNSIRKLLMAKFQVVSQRADSFMISQNDVNLLTKNIYRSTGTLLADKQGLLPIKVLDNKKIASLAIGVNKYTPFNKYFSRYTQVDQFCMPLLQDSSVLVGLEKYDIVLVGIFPFASTWQDSLISSLQSLARTTSVILIHFGNPEQLPKFKKFDTVLAAYTTEFDMPEIIAEQIFGALPINGTLPLSIGGFSSGTQLKTKSLQRIGFGSPYEVGMESQTLDKIKDIAYEAIQAGATPGCRILVARKGKIIYDHSYGWLSYENKTAVSDETIYDLASVTKVSATLQTTAFLYEKGLIDLNKKMSVYLPELKGTNKEDLIIKDILTHQAGLWPFLPFWAQTMKDSLHLPEYYSPTRSVSFPHDVSKNLYASATMKDSLWQWIIKSKMREKPVRTAYDYRYSDMGFYMLQRLAERLLNQPMEDFLSQNLYEPLGAYTIGYLPLNRFPESRIAPTERDNLFRKSLLTGFVHDQGAAMHGGVAGHAGLFGTAYDLVKLAQLWLNKGLYAEQHYFNPETISLFTKKQYEPSRRGLGWDKRDFSNDAINPTSKYSSNQTYGHTGFTGTCVWIDPDYELIYIFLSNRVHPSMTNNKLLTMNIRTRIHDVVYESIFNFLPSTKTTSTGLKLSMHKNGLTTYSTQKREK
jgi:beta-N-acetylhexosaminidase